MFLNSEPCASGFSHHRILLKRIVNFQPLSEIQEDLTVREQRKHLFPHAALVGLGAGAVVGMAA